MPEYTSETLPDLVRGFTWPEDFDTELEHEVQTDKDRVKVVPCRECKRPLVVTTFFAPAKAQCRSCSGEADTGGVATVGVPVPGQTDPAKAVNLTDALINIGFRTPPLCPLNGEHTVELKSVSYAPHHGPRHIRGYDGKGMPIVDQEVGETCMYQCTECNTAISFSTTHQGQYRRINEPREKRTSERNSWEWMLGFRNPDAQPNPELAHDLQYLTKLDVLALLHDNTGSASDHEDMVEKLMSKFGISWDDINKEAAA